MFGMNIEEAVAVIRGEGLGQYARFAPPDRGSANKVCLFGNAGQWTTLMTDERAVVQEGTVRSFMRESDALSDKLDGLRVLKSYMNL